MYNSRGKNFCWHELQNKIVFAALIIYFTVVIKMY